LLKREAYSFKSVGTPITNARLSNESREPCEINCTNISRAKTRTVKSTYSQNLSAAITRRSTVRPAWLPQMSQIPTYSRCGSEWRKDGARCASRRRDIASVNTSESVRRRPNLPSRPNEISVRRSFELSKLYTGHRAPCTNWTL